MPKAISIETLVKISKLYYEDGLTQQEISKIMNTSRTNIVHLLSEAKKRNIVQIKVVNPLENYRDLEKALCDKYGLLDACIIPTYYDYQFHLKEIGKCASQVLLKFIKPYNVIGVGWGNNTLAAAESLDELSTKINVEWIPLAGGFGGIGDGFQTNEIAQTFQNKIGGNFFPFNVPAVVDNDEIRKMIMSDTNVSKIYEKWNMLDVVLLGIGAPESSQAVRIMLDAPASEVSISTHAVGELVANCYDRNGEYCKLPFNTQRIGIPFPLLQKASVKIGIAAEMIKRDAIFTGLKHHLINVLVTNKEMADYLIERPLDEI